MKDKNITIITPGYIRHTIDENGLIQTMEFVKAGEEPYAENSDEERIEHESLSEDVEIMEDIVQRQFLNFFL